MTTSPSILGLGFAYPFRLNANRAKPLFLSEEELVRSDMHALLNTDIKERPFLVRNGVPFGTRIPGLLFDNSTTAKDTAVYDATRSLNTWEPRIVLLQVTGSVQSEGGGKNNLVIVDVMFRYRATNRLDNFVNPYRINPLPANTDIVVSAGVTG